MPCGATLPACHLRRASMAIHSFIAPRALAAASVSWQPHQAQPLLAQLSPKVTHTVGRGHAKRPALPPTGCTVLKWCSFLGGSASAQERIGTRMCAHKTGECAALAEDAGFCTASHGSILQYAAAAGAFN